MTAASLIRAWLLGPLALIAALLLAARIAPEPPDRFHGAWLAVIGSSLSAHALPESGQVGGMAHWRIGVALPAEAELLDLVDSAVAERPGMILLEANPLIAGFAFDPRHRTCAPPAGAFRLAIKRAQLDAADRLRRLFGQRTSAQGMGEPVGLNRAQVIDQALVRASYPLVIHRPCDEGRLAAAVRRARAQGTGFALVLLPRSPAGERLLGPAQGQAARAEALALAARLGVPLFEPPGPWRDAQFMDHAHFNTAGRARYSAELGRWLEQQR